MTSTENLCNSPKTGREKLLLIRFLPVRHIGLQTLFIFPGALFLSVLVAPDE
jgi:hypothetical protein